MCGIAGYYNFFNKKINKQESFVLKNIFIKIESRGTDACGWVQVDEKSCEVVKFPLSFSETFSMISKIKNVNSEEIFTDFQCVLGHSRAATGGDPHQNKNNHPFESKNFVLAHNGVFRDLYDYDYEGVLALKYNSEYGAELKGLYLEKLSAEPMTDSYQLLKIIQKKYDKSNNEIKAIKEAIENFYWHGTMAVWIFSKNSRSLYLFRDTNPIHWVHTEEGLWFASEKKHLENLLGFNNHLIQEMPRNVIVKLNNYGIEKEIEIRPTIQEEIEIRPTIQEKEDFFRDWEEMEKEMEMEKERERKKRKIQSLEMFFGSGWGGFR